MPAPLSRRRFTTLLGASLLAPALARAADAPAATLALAWRGPREDDTHHAGRWHVDWAAGRLTLRHAVALPGRPHGLLAEDDGALLVLAMRPGAWLLRLDALGRVQTQRWMDDEPGAHRLDGHAVASADGRWLYTTETDPRTGQGWIGVRDRASLAKQAQWPTHGIDPHQLLLDGPGRLLVAHGGIPRDGSGRKRDLDRMRSSLVQLDAASGRLQGQWQLADPRLSMRHMALAATDGTARLGIALQAEHDDPAQRAQAPLLALWDGQRLHTPRPPAAAAGYAGDIAATPDGGFLVSAQRANRVLHWRPDAEPAWSVAGQLTDPCALGGTGPGDEACVLLGARGIGRWHPREPAAMLPWPQAMAVDNHCTAQA